MPPAMSWSLASAISKSARQRSRRRCLCGQTNPLKCARARGSYSSPSNQNREVCRDRCGREARRDFRRLEEALALVDEIADGTTGYLIERAVDEARAKVFRLATDHN